MGFILKTVPERLPPYNLLRPILAIRPTLIGPLPTIALIWLICYPITREMHAVY